MLDAVGAGELPDADEYGDEGRTRSGTSRAPSAGSTCPTSRRSGSETSSRSRAARRSRRARDRRPARRALEGQGHDDRPLGADGRRHADRIPTYPHGFPHDVIDPFMHRRGAACSATSPRRERRSSRSSARSTSAPASGSSTRPRTRCSRSPRTRRRAARGALQACRAAREILTGKHAVGRVIARPFTGTRGTTSARRTGTTSRSSPSAPTIFRSFREAGCEGARRREDQRHLRRAATSTSRYPTKSNIEGIHEDRAAAALNSMTRFVFVEPRRDGLPLGAPQRPRELPSLSPGFRSPAARSARRAPARRPPSSSRPITVAIRRLRRLTTRASTRCCSPTSQEIRGRREKHDGRVR